MKVLRRVTMAQVKKEQQRQEKLGAEQAKGRVLGATKGYRDGFAKIAWR